MTLLPIIYTSLLIFLGLLLFVIMISYISYKLKGGQNQLKRHNQFEPQHAIASTPIRVIPSVIPAPKVVIPEYRPIKNMDSQKNTNQFREADIKKELDRSEIRRPAQLKINLDTNRNGFERFTRRENHTRLEIMNTSEKYSNKEVSIAAPIRNVRTAQSLSDANILNYYSDRTDNGFVSLRAI